jgi:hypothetical protein
MSSHRSVRTDDRLRALLDAYEAGRLNRRQVIRGGTALGLAVPAMVALTRRARAQGETTEELQLGDFEDRTLRVSIAFAEVEAEVFREVVAGGSRTGPAARWS